MIKLSFCDRSTCQKLVSPDHSDIKLTEGSTGEPAGCYWLLIAVHSTSLVLEQLHQWQGLETGEAMCGVGTYKEEHTSSREENPFLLECLSSTL